MTRKKGFAIILALTFSLILGSFSLAARPTLTGAGGGPETTVTAPHTASTGQTVRPGGAGAPALDPSERTQR